MTMSLVILADAVAISIDNTFVGTLLAGVVIAALGLKLYREQKELDLAFAKKIRIQELATAHLTHINVAVKDYLGQVGIHDGTNPAAKMIFQKMESLSPGFASKETSNRFTGYIQSITQSFNELATPLALDPQNESRVKLLAEAIPQMTFLLSATNVLAALSTKDLLDVSKQMSSHFDKVRPVLENIIKE